MPQFTPAQVGLAQAGDEAALACVLAHMMPMIRSSAAGCIGPGMELEDAVQEGIIGLFRALESYDVCRDASFETYAGACIQHAQQAAKRAACRKKHLPLNSYVSIYEEEKTAGEISAAPLIDTLPDDAEKNPEVQFFGREYSDLFQEKLQEQLSPLESRVFYLHLQGIHYRTIAELIDKSPKTVDNALQRIKQKAEKLLKAAES